MLFYLRRVIGPKRISIVIVEFRAVAQGAATAVGVGDGVFS